MKRPKVSFGIERTEIEDLIWFNRKVRILTLCDFNLEHKKANSSVQSEEAAITSASHIDLDMGKRREQMLWGKRWGEGDWSWFYDRRCEAWLE